MTPSSTTALPATSSATPLATGPGRASRSRLAGCALAAILWLAAVLPAAGHSDRVTPPPVPLDIEVPAGHRAFLIARAFGTQNYICLPAASGQGLAWTLFGPQATIFDDQARQLLTHFLSPNPVESGTLRATWLHSRDTSAVWAMATGTAADPAFVEAGAIPWLRLRVVGAAQGPDGGDRLMRTAFIQRVNTAGGAAPAPDCPTIGQRTFVPYAADYVFFEPVRRRHDDGR